MMLLPEYLVCHIDTHHELVLLLPDGGRIAWPHLKPEIGHVDGRLRVVVVPVDPLERHLFHRHSPHDVCKLSKKENSKSFFAFIICSIV